MEDMDGQLDRDNAERIAKDIRRCLKGKRFKVMETRNGEVKVGKITQLASIPDPVLVIKGDDEQHVYLLLAIDTKQYVFESDLHNELVRDLNLIIPIFDFSDGIMKITYMKQRLLVHEIFIPVGNIPKPTPATPAKPKKKSAKPKKKN